MESNFDAVTAKAFEPTELTLSCKGLSCVNWDCGDPDFDFVVGDDKVCRVHSVLAEFLCPKVARLRRCDISFDVYTFKDSELFDVFESLVSSLRSGESYRVEKSNFVKLVRLSQELENDELLSSLLGVIKTESLTVEEAIVLLRTGIDLGTAFSGRFCNLGDFIASHFYELEKEILDDLDLETAQVLLSSPFLKIEDEDSLYDFVRSRSQNDCLFARLFEFVYFEYLSVGRVENLASFESENFFENLNSGIWRQICRRLILQTKPKKNPHVFSAEDREPIAWKFTLVGSSGVGKTALVSRFVEDTFLTDSEPTLMSKYDSTIIDIDGQQINLNIWDTSGQEVFRAAAKNPCLRPLLPISSQTQTLPSEN